jgi:hypothetical protein
MTVSPFASMLSVCCSVQYGDDDAAIVLVANKADAVDRKVVSDEEGAAFARKHKLPFFSTSARTDTSVTDVS